MARQPTAHSGLLRARDAGRAARTRAWPAAHASTVAVRPDGAQTRHHPLESGDLAAPVTDLEPTRLDRVEAWIDQRLDAWKR